MNKQLEISPKEKHKMKNQLSFAAHVIQKKQQYHLHDDNWLMLKPYPILFHIPKTKGAPFCVGGEGKTWKIAENRALKWGSSPCPPQKIGSHDFGQSLKGFVA
jgi:hypothetical protein